MKKRLGFTLVEVSLFLGITALLFLGVTIGTQNAINQQRHSDAVNGFTDFLKNVYSEVSNPQSTGNGNSKKAIYGRLIVFGETYSIEKEVGSNGNERYKENEGKRDIYVYDVLGDAGTLSSSDDSLGGLLSVAKVSAFNYEKIGDQGYNRIVKVIPAGETESYSPRWQSIIETTTKGTGAKLSILIVRHPRSGTINTLVVDETLEVNTVLQNALNNTYLINTKKNDDCIGNNANCKPYDDSRNMLKNKLGSFSAKEVDLCINVFGDNTERRRNVRIVENARNAAGVILVDADSSDNRCN